MADYLSTFYEQSKKKKKTSDVSNYLKKNIGKSKDNEYDFYDTFASSSNPKLAKEISSHYTQRKDQEKKLLDSGLNAGLSWEDISSQSGMPLEKVQSYSQQTRPDYGIKKAPTASERYRAFTGKGQEAKLNQQIQNLLNNPEVPEEDKQRLLDIQQQTKDNKNPLRSAGKAAGSFFSGTEKLIDSAEALTGIAAKRQQNDDALLREGKISKTEYQRRNEARLEDTKWAGTEDKGTGDRLKKAAGVSLQATSELVPFVGGLSKGAKAAQGSTSAARTLGKSFAGNSAFGTAASAGRQLAETGKIDAKTIARDTLVSGVLGTAGTGIGMGYKRLKPERTAAFSGGARQSDDLMKQYEIARNSGDTATMKAIEDSVPDPAMLGKSSGRPTVDPATGKIVASGADLERVPRGNAVPFSGQVDGVTQSKIDDLVTRAEATPRPPGTVRVFQATGKGTKSDWVTDNIDRLQSFKNNVTGSADNFSFRDVPQSSLVPTKNGDDIFRVSTQTPIEKISNIDEQLVKTKDPQKAAALAIERQSISQSLPPAERKLANDIAVVSRGAIEDVPTLAKKTEERAIVKGLTKGFDDLPTDVRANFAAQRAAVNESLKTNYDDVLDVAMGRRPAPEGIEAAHFYRAAEDKAIKDGDALTLQLLASKSALPQQAREAGRAIGAYGYKDPNSPVDAIREINNLRQAAEKRGIKIPSNVVTTEETKSIVDLAKLAEQKKNTWLDAGGKIDDASRLDYGRAQVAFRNKINDLKLAAEKQTLREKGVRGIASDIAGNTKSLQSSMDNSALFRQGWKTLWTNPGKWSKNSLKTWSDLTKAFGGKQPLDELAADIVSRPNADLYKRAKLAVGIDEEAFPASLGERIPLLGRAYKASEAAYTGFLQRQRVDIFDKYVDVMQKTGVDMDTKQLQDVGKLVNSLTGRGHLGKLEPVGNTLNNVFFSPRMLKSNFDVLTAHRLQQGVTPFVKKQAAKNLLKIASGTAAVLAVADVVRPGSVEWDPRSSNFGKIKIGNTRFDVTGGMGSLTTLASRLAMWSKKSSTTGDVKSLTGGGFGSTDAADLMIDFFENKLSPAAGVIRDVARGEDFNGNKPTVLNTAKNLVTPLSIQNFLQAKEPGAVDPLIALIADGLGISANSYSSSPNWRVDSSKELKAFKDKVGKGKFDEARKTFDQQYSDWYAGVEKDARFKKLSNEDKQLVRTNKAKKMREDVLKTYNFEYKVDWNPNDRLKGF